MVTHDEVHLEDFASEYGCGVSGESHQTLKSCLQKGGNSKIDCSQCILTSSKKQQGLEKEMEETCQKRLIKILVLESKLSRWMLSWDEDEGMFGLIGNCERFVCWIARVVAKKWAWMKREALMYWKLFLMCVLNEKGDGDWNDLNPYISSFKRSTVQKHVYMVRSTRTILARTAMVN